MKTNEKTLEIFRGFHGETSRDSLTFFGFLPLSGARRAKSHFNPAESSRRLKYLLRSRLKCKSDVFELFLMDFDD